MKNAPHRAAGSSGQQIERRIQGEFKWLAGLPGVKSADTVMVFYKRHEGFRCIKRSRDGGETPGGPKYEGISGDVYENKGQQI